MDAFRQDLRYGLRALRAKPGFTAVAVAMLAVGIGANTAIFSAVNALLFRPLPIEDADRVVFGFALRDGFDPFGTSLLEYAAYRERSAALAVSGVGVHRSFNLAGRGEPERLHGAAVTPDYLGALGVEPALGRGFTAAEGRSGGPAVALVGHELWQRRFGGDRDLVGRTLTLEGRGYEVVGVMPPGFDLPYAAEIWVPLQLDVHAMPLEQRAQAAFAMTARLAPGVSIEQADAELKAIARQLEQEYPQVRRGWSYTLLPLRQQLIGDLDGRIRRALFALVAAVGFLLLICCVNVANLLMARGVGRERELAVRLALGAGRWRVARQLLTESMLLALSGGAAGLLLAYWLTPLLGAMSPIQPFSLGTFLNDFRIDGRALGFALLASTATGLIFGSIPAVRAARTGDLPAVLRRREQRSGGTSAGRRWLGALVVGEIAAAATLLVGGGLMVRSLRQLQEIELGFRPDDLLLMQLPLPADRYREHHQRAAFAERVLERVAALPGVASAGMTTNVPLQQVSIDSSFTVEGRPAADPAGVPITAHRYVTADYLRTLGVTLVKGRLLDERDRAGALPVVVVSEELARQAWPGEDPIGKRIRRGKPHQTSYPWLTVVGVVEDVKEDRFNFRIDRPAWYLPYAQVESSQPLDMPLNLVVKSGSGDPAGLAAAVRDAIRSIDAEQPVSNVVTMEAYLADVLVAERFSALLMGTLAALGLALAALGLYGVMAYSVSQRTGEIGLRMALGARPRDILKMVVGHGTALAGVGLVIGVCGAMALSRLLSSILYGVSPTDPATFVLVAALLAAVALLACYLPARRATKVEPMEALRQE